MGGRITHVPAPKDDCIRGWGCADKPSPNDYKPGTQWTCDNCGKVWVVVEGAQYNEPYQAWRTLTEKNKNGMDRF